MISEAVAKNRKEFGESDRKRDEGLTTPEDIVRFDDISYGPYDQWNLTDIYYTKGTEKKQPVIVSIHGGGWTYGTKEVYQFYCMELAKKGFTVVNFNYRLAPENPYPAALEDINRLFCFLEEKGEDYFADTEQIFVVGDSAGAQLACQYLTILTNPRYAKQFSFETPGVYVRAVALNCGVYDLYNCGEEQIRTVYREYTGKEIDQRVDSLEVMKYMTGDFPPAFVASSHHDFLLKAAAPMHEFLKKLGVETRLKIYGSPDRKEVAHVFHVNIKLPEAGECNEDECAFFKRFVMR